jgi:hypothetical protein
MIASTYLIPWLKTKLDTAKLEKMNKWVAIGVSAAQQLYTQEQWAEKKQYVVNFLKTKGYNADLQEVDAAIEAEVIRLHNQLGI